jgi:uncharacterized membrane protein
MDGEPNSQPIHKNPIQGLLSAAEEQEVSEIEAGTPDESARTLSQPESVALDQTPLENGTETVGDSDEPTPLDETPTAELQSAVAVSLTFRERLRALGAPGALVVVASLYALIYACRIIFPHHLAFGSQGFDYGIFDQGVYLMSRFKAPFVTIMGRNLFADHGSFTLLPLVPLYWIWPSGIWLYGAQTASITLAAIPIYGAAKKILNGRSWIAAAVALSYLVNPVVAWTGAENFHPDSLAILGLATAWWALVNSRWRWFIFACVWVAATKEDMCLVVIPLGLYCARKHNKKVGYAVAGGSLLWTIATLILLRVMNGVGSLNSWRIPFGGPKGSIMETLKRPGTVWAYFLTDGRPWYSWQLVFPLGLVALFAWKRSVPALMGSLVVFASNMVSTFFYQHNAHYHYSGIIIPGLAIAAAFGLSSERFRSYVPKLAVLTLALSVWVGYLWGPMPASRNANPWSRGNPNYDATMALVDLVPDNVVVAADYRVVAYLSHRREAYQYPVPFKDSYWNLPDDESGGIDLARRAARVEYLLLPLTLEAEAAGVWATISSQFKVVQTSTSGWAIYRRIP